MSANTATLDAIERWMQSVIMHPGGINEGMESAEAREHLPLAPDALEEVIARSRSQTSSERLEIYVTAYRMRLMECLRAEFSVTRQAIGDELFDALMYGYLQRHPSTSYTLGELGARFPQFLAASPVHVHAAPADASVSWGQFVVELARWERLVSEVFDGPGSEATPGLRPESLARLQADDWVRLRLIPAPDLRLAIFAHPVHRYWSEARAGNSPPLPGASVTHLAVHRLGFTVIEHELLESQYALLEGLVSGCPLGEAVGDLLHRQSRGSENLGEQVHQWFAEWSRRGFFCDAEWIP